MDNKNISSYTIDILNQCHKRNIKLAIATARSEKVSERIARLIEPDIMILNNGSLVKDINGTIIFRKKISMKETNQMLQFCYTNKIVSTVETDDGYYVSYTSSANHPDYGHAEYNSFEKPLDKEAYKIVVELKDENLINKLRNEHKSCSICHFTGETWCGVYPGETSKLNGIIEACNYYKIKLEETMAFGDDYNDIEMVKRCGIGVAIGNGIEEIKSEAKYICGDNNSDGVAKWIEENFLLKKV
jgi:Cof subfamily protein (haloacid dehalogenase superfamily)